MYIEKIFETVYTHISVTYPSLYLCLNLFTPDMVTGGPLSMCVWYGWIHMEKRNGSTLQQNDKMLD